MASSSQRLAMNLSLGAAVLMLVGKMFAFFLTGSTAILSDAAESVVHIVVTVIAAVSLWYSQRPADEHHPYGHGRIVFFSIGLEGGLIFAAAIFILAKAIPALIYGAELQELGLGLCITAGLAVVNFVLGLYIIRTGIKENVPVLIANGKHLITDMITSAAVVAGVGVVWMTGIVWLDPAIAILAAAQIIFTGSSLLQDSFEEAMDAVPSEDTKRLVAALQSFVAQKELSGYHQLRHRRANAVRWIEVHLLMPGKLSLTEGHKRATQVEERLVGLFPREQVFVTSHIEPAAKEHDLAHPGGHGVEPIGGG